MEIQTTRRNCNNFIRRLWLSPQKSTFYVPQREKINSFSQVALIGAYSYSEERTVVHEIPGKASSLERDSNYLGIAACKRWGAIFSQ